MTNAVASPTQEATAKKPLPRQFVSFALYSAAAEWRRLPKEYREQGKQEFEQVIKRHVDSKSCQILTFSTVGMRSEGEMLLWVIAYELESIQKLQTDLRRTELGRYLTQPFTFLSMTKRSMYLDRFNPEHPEDRAHLVPGKYKYIFVYPFVKKREWYVMPFEQRQEMMDEHIRIGVKYPSVKLNTTYSFGLDDQDFVVAFESDHPQDFLDLVQELRESQGSLYTQRDTPIITGIKMDVREMLDALGA